MRADFSLHITKHDHAGNGRIGEYTGAPLFELSSDVRVFLTGDDATDLRWLQEVSNAALNLTRTIEARRAAQNQPPLYPNLPVASLMRATAVAEGTEQSPPNDGAAWERHDDPEENQ